jgi:hypothetical protein
MTNDERLRKPLEFRQTIDEMSRIYEMFKTVKTTSTKHSPLGASASKVAASLQRTTALGFSGGF